MKKSKLFKSVEGLIDDADQANKDAGSSNPAASISAVDFDAEIANLLGEQADAGNAPDYVEGGDTTGNEAPASDGEPGTTDDGSMEEPGPSTDAEQADGGQAEEPAAEEGGEEDEGSYEPEPSAPPSSDVAVESILRLCRGLEALELQHETAVVTPELAAIVNNEADSVCNVLDLEMPPSAALEAEGAESRYAAVKGRVLEVLKQALEWLKTNFERVRKWVKDFIATYNARRGVYPRTIDGYLTRIKTLGDFQSGNTFTVPLGPLSNNENTNTVDSMYAAMANASSLNMKVVAPTKLDPQTINSLNSLDSSDGEGQSARLMVQFFSITKAYNITTSSSSLTQAASIDQSFQQGKVAGEPTRFAVSGIPGGNTLVWNYVDLPRQEVGFEQLIQYLSRYTFEHGKQECTNQEIELPVNPATAQDIFVRAQALAVQSKGLTLFLDARNDTFKKVTDYSNTVIKNLSKKDMGITYAQDATRVVALYCSAFERMYVLPALAACRMQDQLIMGAIKLGGNIVAKVEEEIAASKAGQANSAN